MVVSSNVDMIVLIEGDFEDVPCLCSDGWLNPDSCYPDVSLTYTEFELQSMTHLFRSQQKIQDKVLETVRSENKGILG